MLLPNGITAFRFADGSYYDVDTMVLAGEAPAALSLSGRVYGDATTGAPRR